MTSSILSMMSSKFGNCIIFMRKVIIPQFYKDLIKKTGFFEGWSWFKFNNLGLAPGTNSKFYTSAAKGLKLKVRKFLGLNPTFVEVTVEKLVGKTGRGGGAFLLPSPLSVSRSVLGELHLT